MMRDPPGAGKKTFNDLAEALVVPLRLAEKSINILANGNGLDAHASIHTHPLIYVLAGGCKIYIFFWHEQFRPEGEADTASLGRGYCTSTMCSELCDISLAKEAMEMDKKMQS